MNIPFHSFEQHIDEKILKRGLQYFKDGYVRKPDIISDNKYEAIVEGTELYAVNLTIENEVITQFSCTCPYNMGPVCKHVVAVIFYLQQDKLKLNEKHSGKKQSKDVEKQETIEEQVNQLLGSMSHADLKAYIRKFCLKNRDFRNLFLSQNAHFVIPDSKKLYAKQVKTILKNSYSDYYETPGAGDAVYELVLTAEEMLESGNLQTALCMASAVAEEMSKVIGYADDSNGEIAECIDSAIETLRDISNQPLPETLRTEFFSYCIDAFQGKIFTGMEWYFTLLDIAVNLIRNDMEVKQIYALLDQIKLDDNFDTEDAQEIRLQLIEKFEGEDKATQYVEANLNNSRFRKITIGKAIDSKDYIRAISLAESGLEIDAERTELANNWRDYLLKIYLLMEDTENIMKYARYMFLNSYRERKGYFDIMKTHTLPDNWNKYVEGLIAELIKRKSQKVGFASETIVEIYIWEERWSDLLQVLKRDPSLESIESYEKYLSKDFSGELTDLYQKFILKYMAEKMGREHYRKACYYLQRMIGLNAREKANFVISQLKKLYPRRAALMDELKSIK